MICEFGAFFCYTIGANEVLRDQAKVLFVCWVTERPLNIVLFCLTVVR